MIDEALADRNTFTCGIKLLVQRGKLLFHHTLAPCMCANMSIGAGCAGALNASNHQNLLSCYGFAHQSIDPKNLKCQKQKDVLSFEFSTKTINNFLVKV